MKNTIEGEVVVQDFDPMTEAGNTNTLCVKEFEVTVSDGNGLNIQCDKTGGNDVFESALSIVAMEQTATGRSGIQKVNANKTELKVRKNSPTEYSVLINSSSTFLVEIMTLKGRLVNTLSGSGPKQIRLDSSLLPTNAVLRVSTEREVVTHQMMNH